MCLSHEQSLDRALADTDRSTAVHERAGETHLRPRGTHAIVLFTVPIVDMS